MPHRMTGDGDDRRITPTPFPVPIGVELDFGKLRNCAQVCSSTL